MTGKWRVDRIWDFERWSNWIYSERKRWKYRTRPSFLVSQESSIIKEKYFVLQNWFFKYSFTANNVANINFSQLRMLSLSVSYLLFVFQDTVIYDRLAETSKYKEITLKHLEQFATEGEYNTIVNMTQIKWNHVLLLSYRIILIILLGES